MGSFSLSSTSSMTGTENCSEEVQSVPAKLAVQRHGVTRGSRKGSHLQELVRYSKKV